MNSPLGIAFIGGEGPGPAVIRAVMEEARSTGASTLAAADSGLHLAESAGFRPDCIIGDMDSLDPPRLADYPPDRIFRYPADKDFTDTELALQFLWERDCLRIWLLGGGGGRTDHLFALRSLFEREKPPERWVTANEDIRCIEAGSSTETSAVSAGLSFPAARKDARKAAKKARFGKVYPISVFPLGPGPWKVQSTGLLWPLDDLSWDRGFFGVSNAAPSGSCTINAIQGRFMVLLPLLY